MSKGVLIGRGRLDACDEGVGETRRGEAKLLSKRPTAWYSKRIMESTRYTLVRECCAGTVLER